jgi:hypothetical protein
MLAQVVGLSIACQPEQVSASVGIGRYFLEKV